VRELIDAGRLRRRCSSLSGEERPPHSERIFVDKEATEDQKKDESADKAIDEFPQVAPVGDRRNAQIVEQPSPDVRAGDAGDNVANHAEPFVV
jgi:hypothetical protein